ncbi:RHS repeat domain-containing protein [Thermodesulfobacteriota bacterium]
MTYYINEYYEEQGGVPVKYIFGGNLRIAMIKGTIPYYFHKDHLNSSTAITDINGEVVGTTEYKPFGSTRSQTGTDVTNYKFTDQELDPTINLYNYDARLYDPSIGRFITADTIVPEPFDPQTFDRYAYCRNNPLIYIDPTGHYFGDWGIGDFGALEAFELGFEPGIDAFDEIVAALVFGWGYSSGQSTDSDSGGGENISNQGPNTAIDEGEYTPATGKNLVNRGSSSRGTVYCEDGQVKAYVEEFDPFFNPFPGCVKAHEKVHVDAINKTQPNICKGVKDGTLIFGDKVTEGKREQEAIAKEIECLESKRDPGKYDPILEREIRNQERRFESFNINYIH